MHYSLDYINVIVTDIEHPDGEVLKVVGIKLEFNPGSGPKVYEVLIHDAQGVDELIARLTAAKQEAWAEKEG